MERKNSQTLETGPSTMSIDIELYIQAWQGELDRKYKIKLKTFYLQNSGQNAWLSQPVIVVKFSLKRKLSAEDSQDLKKLKQTFGFSPTTSIIQKRTLCCKVMSRCGGKFKTNFDKYFINFLPVEFPAFV